MRVIILLAAVLLSGCATYSEIMVNANGEARQCSATGQGVFGMSTAKNARDACVKDLRAIGYLPIDEAGAIGVQMNGVEIVRVIPGKPAERAGLQAGDVILSVDGEPARDDTVSDLMWGRVGETMTLTVDRGGEELQFSIVRTSSRIVNQSSD